LAGVCMEQQFGKIKIQNKFTQPIMLFIEPWGRDYWLQPEQSFEVIAIADDVDENFYFHIIHSEYRVDIWAEGQCYDVLVSHKGQELECGYLRPKDYSA
jgi:hypothetical protein